MIAVFFGLYSDIPTKTLSMNGGGSVSGDHLSVMASAIALVFFESVEGVFFGLTDHKVISFDLCDDRGDADLRNERVTVDNGFYLTPSPFPSERGILF